MQELGLQAAGVDESIEMLAHLPAGVEGIESTIESLNLGRCWPAVLLPSHLINHPDTSVRKSFVQAARRHTQDAGTFYVKRHSPRWLSTVQAGQIGDSHGIALHADHVARNGKLVTMTIRYATAEQSWTQSFSTYALEQDEIEDLLMNCGFQGFQWLGAERLWVAAIAGDA